MNSYPYSDAATMRAHRRALRAAAHRLVRVAVMDGRIPAATSQLCADCGGSAAAWDHRDYREPLKVEAVCTPCNTKRPPALPWAPHFRKIPREHAFGVGIVFQGDEIERVIGAATAMRCPVEEMVRRAAIAAAVRPLRTPGGIPIVSFRSELAARAIDFDDFVHGRHRGAA